MKICNKCKEEKELSEFGKDKHLPMGLKRYCKVCQLEDWYKKRKPKPTIEFIDDEIWKPITTYETLYHISNKGRVKSLEKRVFYEDRGFYRLYYEQILKPIVRNKQNKYLMVNLHNENGMKSMSIHRLVAETFIPNPENKPQVNHKDLNKHNNNIDNLEWVTERENCTHAQNLINKKKSQYNGVYLSKTGNRWLAHISIGRRNEFLGSFITEEEASLAYKKAIKDRNIVNKYIQV